MLLLNKYLKVGKLIAFLLLFKSAISQNLIQNSSFELSTNNDCYGSFDHHIFPNPHILDNWYNFNSPDYFHSICTGWYAIPDPYFGSSYAKHGNAFIGIGVYDMRSNYQEYTYQQLSAPLQAGKVYCLSFYVSRADRFPFAIKNIGAYFSPSLPTLISGEYINAIPQVINQNGFLTDTINWIQIQDCFTAQGGEQFMIIGNFNDNSSTDTLRIPSPNLITGIGTDVAYYYIDDILLYDQSTVGIIAMDNLNSVNVYPNPAKDILNINLSVVKENTQINIYNSLGELVLSESLVSQISSLKTHHLKSGIYFYRILVEGSTIKSDKIVIIK